MAHNNSFTLRRVLQTFVYEHLYEHLYEHKLDCPMTPDSVTVCSKGARKDVRKGVGECGYNVYMI